MKLKINKACDLNSISVLPPHTRRSNIMQQPRTHPSQQSFSQGFSSQQNGIFSQISQNSVGDAITEYQKLGSQEKDNSIKRLSYLAPISSYSREENQKAITRSSSSLTRRWSSANVADHDSQQNDELEQKITMMETSLTSSLNRLGIILDSVQADVMQVNKATKELSLEVDSIRQKSVAHQDSLHFLNRAQEDQNRAQDETRCSLELISNQLQTIIQQDKIQEILLAVSNLREQIDNNYQTQKDELSKCLSRDLQAIIRSLGTVHKENIPPAILRPKVTGAGSGTPTSKPNIIREAEPLKIEIGSWKTVKAELTSNFAKQNENLCRNLKQRRASLDKEQKTIINLDDDTDDDLSCLIVMNKPGKQFLDELEEDTAEILRKARRRKRKQDCRRSIVAQRK
ncbi:putative recombination initiation defects 3 [Amaranthus tricolor]|uniref:putative recombination initiation defects 3 n=1 Tax=Amaranthus tricolor TaxID=29722 RepID=UPI002582A4F2|nr:putative recombination initiation defects 3 [Amaranthus tricolor]XP_057533558.1 putative recombination initiation defects 3 [Amaranthus tricolor]